MKSYILISAAAFLMALFSFSVVNEQAAAVSATPAVVESAEGGVMAGWYDNLWRRATPAAEGGVLAGWYDQLWRRVTPVA